jgi:hypothetical protein
MQGVSATWNGAISIFTRPFLAFSILIVWCFWILKSKSSKFHSVTTVLFTVAVLAILTLINISFSYNRAAVFAPIVALGAVYSNRVQKLSYGFLFATACSFLLVALAWKQYLFAALNLGDLLDSQWLALIFKKIDLIEQFEMYAGAPQFLGFLLEQIDYGSCLYFGQTLISSILYPVPILGRGFRPTSGTALYNYWIYGRPDIIDQVVPFQGELFMNFHVFGVIIGYGFVAYGVFKLQTAFEGTSSPIRQYCFFMMALWASFLIIGSIMVVSQIYIYFFWPLYGFLLIDRVFHIT